MVTVTLALGEHLEVRFKDNDGAFEVHYNSEVHPNALIVKETDGLAGNVKGGASEILYEERWDPNGHIIEGECAAPAVAEVEPAPAAAPADQQNPNRRLLTVPPLAKYTAEPPKQLLTSKLTSRDAIPKVLRSLTRETGSLNFRITDVEKLMERMTSKAETFFIAVSSREGFMEHLRNKTTRNCMAKLYAGVLSADTEDGGVNAMEAVYVCDIQNEEMQYLIANHMFANGDETPVLVHQAVRIGTTDPWFAIFSLNQVHMVDAIVPMEHNVMQLTRLQLEKALAYEKSKLEDLVNDSW